MKRHNTQIATAHHEAGHCLARVKLSLMGEIDLVSICSEDVGAEALGAVFGRPRLPNARGAAIDHEAIRARVVGLLAGPLAEQKFTGRPTSGCGGDVEQAFAELSTAYQDTPLAIANAALRESDPLDFGKRAIEAASADIHRRFTECHRSAGEFVEAHWSEIQALARVLARRKRLSGAEVRAIVEGVR